MNKSNIKALVWVLPNSEFLADSNTAPHNYSTRISTKRLMNGETEITLKTDDNEEEHNWTVDECLVDGTSACVEHERKKLVELAAKGCNAACLFFNIGGDYYTYKKRIEEKKLLFEELEKAIKPSTLIEYAYFCITDTQCYDMRKETFRSVKSVMGIGIDSWMKKVDNVADIWKEASKGAKLPHVLKIRLTDSTTKRPGYFYLFDLFHPRFLPLTPEIERGQHIYYSFTDFRNMVDKVSSTTRQDDALISVDNYVLTSLLAPFICGYGKLVLFNHFNEYPKNHIIETRMALDFITAMRSIKAEFLPNNPVATKSDPVVVAVELEDQCDKLQQTIKDKNTQISSLELEKEQIREKILDYDVRDTKKKAELANLEKQTSYLKEKLSHKPVDIVHKMKQIEREKRLAEEKNMELQKKLNVSNNTSLELRKQLGRVGQLFKKAHNEATSKIHKIKLLGFQRISLLKKQLKEQMAKDQDLITKLQYENVQLQKEVKLVEAKLTREFEIVRKEKNDMRSYLNLLRKSIEEVEDKNE